MVELHEDGVRRGPRGVEADVGHALVPHLGEIAIVRQHLDVDVEACRLRHLFEDDGHLLADGGRGRHGDLERDPAPVPGLAQERFRLVDVGSAQGQLRIERVRGGDGVVVGELAVRAVDGRQHLRAIDGVLEGLPHAAVVEGRLVRRQDHVGEGAAGNGHGVRPGRARDLREQVRAHVPDQVRLLPLERRQLGRLIGEDLEGHRVEVGQPAAVVAGEALHGDAVARHELAQPERPRAEFLGGERLEVTQPLAGHDARHGQRHHGGEVGERRPEGEARRVLVDGVDALDGADLATVRRGRLGIQDGLHGRHGVIRDDLTSDVELDSPPQLEDPHAPAVGGRP